VLREEALEGHRGVTLGGELQRKLNPMTRVRWTLGNAQLLLIGQLESYAIVIANRRLRTPPRVINRRVSGV
jgi:hypothetical protein